MYWDTLTSPALDRLDRNTPVILPIAATEQHGAHLPMATDRLIGEHFCKVLDAEFGEHILILPSVAVGCSDHHLEFCGSLSLSHGTFLRQCGDILASVYRHGFRKILVLNSHGGNMGVGQVLVEKMGMQHRDAHFVLVSWFRLASDALGALQESGPGGVGHAGEFETSLMLNIAPDLVQMDEIRSPQNVKMPNWASGDLIRGSMASYYRTMKELTPSGVFGDPRSASSKKGDKITEIIVASLRKIASDLQQL